MGCVVCRGIHSWWWVWGWFLVDNMAALWVAPSELLGGQDGLEALWVEPLEVIGVCVVLQPG